MGEVVWEVTKGEFLFMIIPMIICTSLLLGYLFKLIVGVIPNEKD